MSFSHITPKPHSQLSGSQHKVDSVVSGQYTVEACDAPSLRLVCRLALWIREASAVMYAYRNLDLKIYREIKVSLRALS